MHEVRSAMLEAIERGRNESKPSYIECQTYRYVGHSLRNDRPKRSDEEIAHWKSRDPLEALRQQMLGDLDFSQDAIDEIDREEREQISSATEFARQSAEPDISQLTTGIFSPDTTEHVQPPRSEKEESRSISYAAALNEAIDHAMTTDERVLILAKTLLKGRRIGVSTGLREAWLTSRFRYTNFRTITGLGIGLALAGARPIVEIQFMDIMTLAIDQIVNQAAKLKYMLGGKPTVPFIVRAPMGAGVRLAAQHSQSLESWFMHVPGLIVAVPSSPYDAKGLLTTALNSSNPVVFLEHKLLYFLAGPVPEERYSIPFGKAEVKSEGEDITVVATSAMVRKAIQAARKLQRKDISVEVIDPRTLAPLDMETIKKSVQKTGRILVVHEACRFGGFGGEIVSSICEQVFSSLKTPPERIGAPSTPVPYNQNLELAYT